MRSLAILLMAGSHVTRLVPDALWPPWGRLVMLIEPYTQALFLGLVGASLVHSSQATLARGGSRSAWMGARLTRMGQLFLLSLVVFWLERGPQWPHGIVSTGILALIAGAIAIFTVTVAAPAPLATTAAVTAALCALSAGLDLGGIEVLAINAGNGPLLPTALHCGLGATAVLAWGRWGRRAGVALLVLGAACVALSLSLASFHDLLNEPLGRSLHRLQFQGRGHGPQITLDMLQGKALKTTKASYFNPRPTLVPLVAGMGLWTYVLLAPLRKLWDKTGRSLLLIGRYSLGTYLFHLALIAVPVLVFGKNPPFASAQVGLAYFGFVVLACYGFAAFRQWQEDRKRAGRGR